jgi:hypothetical protein
MTHKDELGSRLNTFCAKTSLGKKLMRKVNGLFELEFAR